MQCPRIATNCDIKIEHTITLHTKYCNNIVHKLCQPLLAFSLALEGVVKTLTHLVVSSKQLNSSLARVAGPSILTSQAEQKSGSEYH